MKSYKQKKIWITPDRYIMVRVYKNRQSFQKAYKRMRPNDEGHERCLGVCMFECWVKTLKDKSELWHPLCATIMMGIEDCIPKVATHELMHAALYSYNHQKQKRHYPIKISSLNVEEEILHRYSKIVDEFYDWYWKVPHKAYNKD